MALANCMVNLAKNLNQSQNSFIHVLFKAQSSHTHIGGCTNCTCVKCSINSHQILISSTENRNLLSKFNSSIWNPFKFQKKNNSGSSDKFKKNATSCNLISFPSPSKTTPGYLYIILFASTVMFFKEISKNIINLVAGRKHTKKFERELIDSNKPETDLNNDGSFSTSLMKQVRELKFQYQGIFALPLGMLTSAIAASPVSKENMASAIFELRNNPTFMSALIAWTLAQTLKVFTTYAVERRWDPKMLTNSGGMPSSHSALCVALTTSVALLHGIGGPLFPVCLGFSLIVMYDAIGVRYHAGLQAEVLNTILADYFQNHPVGEKKLKELLGHTPLQVTAGAVLGAVVTCLYFGKYVV